MTHQISRLFCYVFYCSALAQEVGKYDFQETGRWEIDGEGDSSDMNTRFRFEAAQFALHTVTLFLSPPKAAKLKNACREVSRSLHTITVHH